MINEKMLALGQAPSAIRELFAYGMERKAQIGDDNVFDFSIGNPSVPAPSAIGKAIAELAALPPQQVHAYSPAGGLPSTRKAIADSLNRRHATDYTPDNLYLTCGAAAAINICLKAIIEPEDEIVVISPFFPEYRVWIEADGAKCVEVPARESDFQIDIDALRKAINEHTKAVIINSPNNPVGVVYTVETLTDLARIMAQKEAEYGRPLFLIADEPYRELAYGDIQVPWVPDFYGNTLVCYSWSKSFSLPGERIGYVLVPTGMFDAPKMEAAVAGAGRALGFICAPVLFQRVIERCVDEPVNVEAYRSNRALLCGVLDEAGFEYIAPDGAFYLWVKSLEPDAQAFSDRAKTHELLLVPSDSFGVPGWVRLGYCVSADTISGSARAFKDLAAEYR